MHDGKTTVARFAQPGRMTSAGRFAPLLESLPRDIPALTAVGHGLLIHEFLVDAYGVTLSDENRENVHIRSVEKLLERVLAADDRPLDVAREPANRIAANCRHYTVLLVSALRAQGTAARARCGFGAYFGGGLFEDHWVCEYWHDREQRWVLVDGQIDDRQHKMFPIDFDVADVPLDRFLVAGQAWARCRSGEASADKFGLSVTNESGYWWIAGNLMRDAAALLGTELLPWDSWGAMPAPEETIDDERAGLFDRLAALTLSPDDAFAELQELCADERLRVPAVVRNDVRQIDEVL